MMLFTLTKETAPRDITILNTKACPLEYPVLENNTLKSHIKPRMTVVCDINTLFSS